jgi:hypothetical protein
MSVFKKLVRNFRNTYTARNIEKINNKLNFENHIVPNFWHNLVNYEALLIANNLEIRFYFGIQEDQCECVLCYKSENKGFYVDNVDDEENYLTYIQLFCKYNITRDRDFYINGISYEIFDDCGIQYVKKIIIEIDPEDFIDSVEKAISENPDYNFAKFNHNFDIKIALKD